MRFHQILQQLDEVRMAPSNLKQFANSPEAKGIMAGFEAEIFFKGANEREDAEESEPDYDYDERTRHIMNVIRFFDNGDHNSSRDLRDLEEAMQNDYYEWLGEKSSNYFFDNAERIVKDYVEEEEWDWDEHIADALNAEGYSPQEVEAALDAKKALAKARNSYDQEELDAAREKHQAAYATYLEGKAIADKQLDEYVEQIIEDQDKTYYAAQENAREAYEESEGTDEDWLSDTGLTHMTDILNTYDINWPYWTYGSDDDNEGTYSEEAAERVAVSFRRFVLPEKHGIEVTSWAGKDKEPNTWYFESDSSLEPDDSSDLAVEIVSPPMPLKQCLEVMEEFFDWANKAGAYTNESSAFHMGVSMPEQDSSKVDFTKLALFLGDKYVLEEFGRVGNSYCKSALKKIEDRVKTGEVDPKKVLESLKGGLNEIASTTLAKNEGFGKFTTINPKEKYIEFRSAGGENYSEDVQKLQTTLQRYSQAMYIASHPELERNEYQKKMYKLLSESEDDTDTIKELSKLSAGKASEQDINAWYTHMREVLRKSQAKRTATKGGKLLVWSVKAKDSAAGARVVAMTAEEALKSAKDNDRNWIHQPDNKFVVKPVSVATPEEIKIYNDEQARQTADRDQYSDQRTSGPQWEVYNKLTGSAVYQFNNPENTVQSGIGTALEWYNDLSPNERPEEARNLGVRPAPEEDDVTTEPSTATGNSRYRVRNLSTGDTIVTGGTFSSPSAAMLWARENHPSMAAALRLDATPLSAERSLQQVETEPQNFPAARSTGGEWTGEWKVVDGSNREVYRFGGVGNSQSDANRVAREWAQSQGFNGNIEVYPVMR